MSNTIISQVLGELKHDDEFHEWRTSSPIPVPFFDERKLPVIFRDFSPDDGNTFVTEADDALATFLSLDGAYRESVSHQVYQNCRDYIDAVGAEYVDPEVANMRDPQAIWQFVHPSEVHVSRNHRGDDDIYIRIDCECDWEEEHGLQLVFRGGKTLTRVSDQDGYLTD